MNIVWKIAAALFGCFVLIMVIGGTRPDTPASQAWSNCDNLRRTSYTPAEKAQAEEICAMIKKDADRKMGRLPAGAP